jgi:hypothetical protein
MNTITQTAKFVLLSISCLWITACASDPYNVASLDKFYQRVVPLVKNPAHSSTASITGRIVNCNPKQDAMARAFIPERTLQFESKYICLGKYIFLLGRPLTPSELVEITSRMGGDYYSYVYSYVGKTQGTRMVMTGFTTPSIISSTSQGSAYGNFNGSYQNNYGGWGTMNGNANANGFGSSQTIVGGSQSFQAVPCEYPVIWNAVVILASPQRQQELIKDGVLTQSLIDQYCLEARIKRGESPAVVK